MSLDVIALGEAMLEFAATEVGRLADVAQFKRGWGGDTSNFAIAAARLGGRVGYITQLGDDEFGRCFLELWQREGVDATAVKILPGQFTGIYFISLRPDRAHDFTYYRQGSAASQIRPTDLDADYVRRARVLHVSGISQAISRSACDTVFAAIETARRAGHLVSYDPNLRLKLWSLDLARAVITHTLGLADIVLPNLEEAQRLLGLDEPNAIVEAILARGAKVVALKLGAAGCLVGTHDGAMELVPSFTVKVADTAGAGDAFDAAFVLSYVNGQPLPEAARFANAVGALACTGAGAVAPIPTRTQAVEFVERSAPELERVNSLPSMEN